MGKEYKEFQKKIYDCLVDYKRKHITRDCGKYKGEEHPEFLPEKFWTEEFPAMLYDGIRETVREIQNKIGFVSPARRYEAPTVVRPPQM